MNKKITFFYFFLLMSVFAKAQTGSEKWLKGQISASSLAVEGITIFNAASNVSVVSDNSGAFSILVKQGDILEFSAVQFEGFRKYIGAQEFSLGIISVELIPKSIQLDEVVINERSGISAENLGLMSKGQHRLTPAERKLQTAGDFKASNLLGLLGGMLAVDPILNAINGRTKMLKKELMVEQKELLLGKLEYLFEHSYYTTKLKIPEEYISGFQYYCIEDPDFVRSLLEKNKTMSMFLMVGLAANFNKIREDHLSKN